MPVQDLVRYRDSGELSDVTVRIGDAAEFRLHKFPLFIKSDYFKEQLASRDADHASGSGGGNAAVELSADFPGGPECFGLIADFCYNKRIDISPENVVQLRSAAEYLKMQGQGNLIDLSDRYLCDLLSAAKMARSAGPLVLLLSQCTVTGTTADEARVSERCLAALLDVWTRTSAVASLAAVAHHYHPHQHYSDVTDSVTEQLVTLPLARFLQLIRAVSSAERGSGGGGVGGGGGGDGAEADRAAAINERLRRRPLAELTARYLDRVFRCRETPPSAPPPPPAPSAAPPTPPERETAEASAPAEPSAEEEAQREKSQHQSPLDADDAEAAQLTRVNFEPKESPADVLDHVILGLPEDTPLAEVIGPDWIRRALRASESASPECRTKLLQLAGSILHRFSPDELRETPAPVLCEIVDNTVKNEGVVPEVLSCVVDNHLLDLARAGSLPVAEFVKLAASMPPDYRTSHDTLFEVAETLLSADPPLSESDRQLVTSAVDLTRCSEDTLQRGMDKDIVPPKLVCQAAIDIARKLREQLTELEKRDTYRSSLVRLGGGTIGAAATSSRRYDTANIRYQDPLPAVHQSQHYLHHYHLDSGYSPASASGAAAAATASTTYGLPYTSSRHDDDQTLAIFEENLRAELGKISASYDHYLADKGVKSEYRFAYRGASGKRW